MSRPGEDFQAEFVDLRQVAAGDGCSRCGHPLEVAKTVEIGHIFKLGYKYSESMGLRVLDEDGEEVTPIMGSYGIGIERILIAPIELFHDKDGMFAAALDRAVSRGRDAGQLWRCAATRSRATALRRLPRPAGLDALLDDRDERPGVKFKDADLIGVPYRITVGKKLAGGKVELVTRRTRASEDVALADVVTHLQKSLADSSATRMPQ